uniref:NRPD902 n=1 Tax=Arundo donax TaxID=35708 RepID=A0A0A9E930_ARUDO
MVIMNVYVKSLKRMLVSTGWPVKKDYIPINYSPTDCLTNFECCMPFRSYSYGIGCLTISVGQTQSLVNYLLQSVDIDVCYLFFKSYSFCHFRRQSHYIHWNVGISGKNTT